MDIVILNSSPNVNNISSYRTIGAYKIAHSSRAAGFSVQVIDQTVYFSEAELVQALLKFVDHSTYVLAISSTFLAIENSYFPEHVVNAIVKIQDIYPNLKLVIGGYGLNAVRLESRFITYATIAEYGEDIFVEVVSHIAGRGPEPKYTIGFVKKVAGKKTYKEYSLPLHVNFDIAKDAFRFVDEDCIMPGETLPIEISRGCIFKCKFCHHLLLGRGKLDYLRDFELVKEEMLYNYSKWGTTNYYVICDTFNDTEFKMKAWYNMLNSLPFKIQYTCYLRADLLNRFPDVPPMLQETGLYSCFHGIETFNEHSAVTIGKGWSAKGAKTYLPELYHNIWGGKIHQTLSFIAGLPGDKREDILEIADWFIDNQMYNISMHSLGLTQHPNLKHASEFERDSAKYGYTFANELPHPKGPGYGKFGYWKNDYWNQYEVDAFVEGTIIPKLKPYNATHGSWQIMQLLQLNLPEESFKWENRKEWEIKSLTEMVQHQTSQYINRLLGL